MKENEAEKGNKGKGDQGKGNKNMEKKLNK